MIIEFKDPMDKYGSKKTAEWYQRHVKKLCLEEIYAPIYDVGTYDGEIWFPFELDKDCAPIDCEPYDTFKSEEKAIECIKRIGGVYAEDYDDMCKKLKLRWYAETS